MKVLVSAVECMPLLDAGLPLYTSPPGRMAAFYLLFSPTQKMLRRILHLLVLLSLTNAGPSFGQQPAHPQPNSAEVEELIRRANLSVSEYKAKFKDLTADEEQKVEEYDGEGKLKRQRRVVSDLII